MTGTVTLRNGANRIELAKRGAELRAWSVDGEELLWNGDPAYWAERSPLLFPVVGWTRDGQSRVGDATYPLGLHGFARASRFEVSAETGTHAVFSLRDSPETRLQYPFGFALQAIYEATARGLSLTLEIENTGDGPMPYAAGVHPGFALRRSADTFVVFDEPEDADVPAIAPGGLISARRRPAPLSADGRTLALDDTAFANDALVFFDVRSRGLDLVRGSGKKLRIEWENFPNVVVWSRAAASFVCVEGWTGSGDPEGFEGDLFSKPGMIVLQPGERRAHTYRVSAQSE